MLTRRLLLVLALLMPLALSVPAFANDALDAAKAAGSVGERPDGTLGVVAAATPALDALVKDVNARRMEVFKGIAAKNGQTLSAVQAVSGEEFIRRTPRGQYVMNAAGAWVTK